MCEAQLRQFIDASWRKFAVGVDKDDDLGMPGLLDEPYPSIESVALPDALRIMSLNDFGPGRSSKTSRVVGAVVRNHYNSITGGQLAFECRNRFSDQYALVVSRNYHAYRRTPSATSSISRTLSGKRGEDLSEKVQHLNVHQ